MEGAGLVSEVPPPYDAPQPAVKFWDTASGTWVPLQPGVGRTIAEFGPEVSFGYAMHNGLPGEDIYLVKYAVGATSLAYNWNPFGGGCYNSLKSAANAALADLRADGRSPVIGGMLWMQGESDAHLGSATASAYATNLMNLIGKARSDFATPNMPFVLGRINAYTWGTPEDNEAVRTAQMTVPGAVGHAAWIDTDDLPLSYAGHYNTQGQIELGIRFAGQFVQTPEPSSIVILLAGLICVAAYVCGR
jgi:hypothetical protein